MYEKPTLVRFGTFRQVTQVGFTGANDGGLITGAPEGDTDGSGGPTSS